MSSPTIIAIDGPAGAGKSTVTKQVAKRLGILYLDTGAMYRAATVGLLASSVDADDEHAVAAWVRQRSIGFDDHGKVQLDGVTQDEDAIRSPQNTREIWRVAGNPGCRDHLVHLQQGIVGDRDCALEGRDATTVICPDATLKIYLDASPEERARRRMKEWEGRDDAPNIETLIKEITERDEKDMNRDVGALQKAEDAVHLVTDGMTPEAVIAAILAHAVRRRPLLLEQQVQDQVIVGRSRQAGYVRVAEGSINNPPAPWQLGLTNPSADRLPHSTSEFARNAGGRQAGVLCQGQAVMCLAGLNEQPGEVVAMPMLPQTWYVIEPGCWHAVVQKPGTICAWAEASAIDESRSPLSADQVGQLKAWLDVYLPGDEES